MHTPPPLVKLGVIVAAHGIRGQVKIRSFTADPRDITEYGPLYDARGAKAPGLTIQGETHDLLIASAEGVKDRNAAELLKGTELYIPKSALPETAEHEYYYEDLIGMDVVLENGTPFGKVRAVENFGAGEVLDVVRIDTKESEILPFTQAVFPAIDVAGGTLTLNPPEYVEAKEE